MRLYYSTCSRICNTDWISVEVLVRYQQIDSRLNGGLVVGSPLFAVILLVESEQFGIRLGIIVLYLLAVDCLKLLLSVSTLAL